jgi:hypothetical protein
MTKQFANVARLGSFGIGRRSIRPCGANEPSVNARPACDDNLKTLDLGAGATVTLVKSFNGSQRLVSLGSLHCCPSWGSSNEPLGSGQRFATSSHH